MKKILLSAICLLPLCALAQNQFVVNGQLGKLNAPAKVFLVRQIGDSTLKDSVLVKNGKFQFKGAIDGPVEAKLIITHDGTPIGKINTDSRTFYLDSEVKLTSTVDSVKTAKITLSAVNDENEKLNALLKPSENQIGVIMKEYGSLTKEQRSDAAVRNPFMEKYKKAEQGRKEVLVKFGDENLNSVVGIDAFKQTIDRNFDPKFVESQYMKFSASARNTSIGKSIEKMISTARNTSEGAMAMNFTQNDVNGKPVSLSDFKGKYVLVDFWASWCGPCRGENPNVVAAFNKYKDKNFTVLGVSLDKADGKQDWLAAIKNDGLTWIQVSDLKYWKNEVAVAWGITGIPANFLIDPNGKIVGKGLRGEDLSAKLAELLDGK